ncbi:10695_t:CDS:1 [Acaulospora morrowiae]|uniref:10695_t:CDS:1 n=1 Tax=Acaulospora morrowiae TaxID=94023 RepID=A0A9N9C9T9_9GLOM|nr:10695_t:CDS:1 [Acaulospora morrowiae]
MQSNPSFPQSTTVAENTATLNNYSEPIDFTIYSQDNSSELENDSYPSIHQVQHNPSYLDESDYYAATNPSSHIHSNHSASLLCYTPHDQSSSTFTSPHGNSLNDNNPLSDFHTNINQISPHSTPLTASEHLLVENVLNSPYSPYIDSPFFSPVCNSFQDVIPYSTTPDFGTPFTACTPLTPYTPLISFNSDLSTPRFVPNTPSTQFIDVPLYETDSKLSNLNLFEVEETKPDLSDIRISVQPYLYPFRTVKMEVIAPPIETTGNDKKPENALVPGTPNSDGSTSGSVSEKSVSSLSPAIDPSEQTNSGSQVGENPEVNTEGPRSPSLPSSPYTSTFPAIRPRPQDDDDDSSEPAIRRSKRQRTRSISENEEENEDDEKKYMCPDCGRGFNRKFNMQTHRATHDPNRVKPFACEHPNCGSRFTRKHDLKRHVNGIHRGERVHSCTVCNKPFSRKDAWKRHVTTCGKM